MQSLRRSVILFFGIALLGIMALDAALMTLPTWPHDRWLAVALLVLAWQARFVWSHLSENAPEGSTHVYESLGPGNLVTLTRGAALAALAGFIFVPPAPGWAAYAPGALYLLAALLDFADGYLARISRMTTRLGSILDMEWDSSGLLIAIAVAVLHGQIPVWYFILGLARYLFIAGIAQRTRRGLPVYDLDMQMIRRALAGLQMGFIAVVLLPIFQPPVTTAAAVIFITPSLVHFWRDWLYISGAWHAHPPSLSPHAKNGLLILRGALALALLGVLWSEASSAAVRLWVIAFALPAFLGVTLGIAGRASALLALLLGGLLIQYSHLSALPWAILFLGAFEMLLGSGPWALWQPENALIYRRAGESMPLPPP